MPEESFFPDNLLARLSKILTSNDAHLKTAVSSLSQHFGDAAFLAQHYIQPHAQSEPPSEGESASRRPVFGLLNEFFEEAKKNQNQSNALLVCGDTGVGKTSLLMMVTLTHLAGLAPSHHDCVLLPLDDSTLEAIGKLRAPRRTILLLDASSAGPDAITEVLQATRAVHRVVITCRPSALRGQLLGATRVVYLSLFNHTQTDKYLKRRFQRMKEPNRKRVKGILNAMGTLGGRPLWLNHMDGFVHTRRKSWNVFAAYEALIDHWLDEEQRRQSNKAWDRDAALQACIHLAMTGEASEPIKTLESKGRSLLRKDRQGKLRFTHRSIHEFLVVLGMKNGKPAGKQRLPSTDLMIQLLALSDDAAVSWQTLDLTSASLAEITLHDADFTKAACDAVVFVRSAFHRANFSQATLRSCEAREVKFDTCTFEGTKAANALLRAATFSGTRLANTLLPGSIFTGARFDGCEFHHTLLADGDFRDAEFANCTINDCSFKGSTLMGTTFRECVVTNVRFDHCVLKGAHFKQCEMKELSLKGADMRFAEVDEAFLTAIKGGAVQHWKTAAWDPDVASKIKLSTKDNERNMSALGR